MRTCETKNSVFNKFSNIEHHISETAYDIVAYGGVRCFNTGFVEHPSNTHPSAEEYWTLVWYYAHYRKVLLTCCIAVQYSTISMLMDMWSISKAHLHTVILVFEKISTTRPYLPHNVQKFRILGVWSIFEIRGLSTTLRPHFDVSVSAMQPC